MILESGWPSCTRAQCDIATVPGTPLQLPIQHGIPFIVLQAVLRDLNAFVEPVMNARGISDEGSWTPTNSVWNSNHLGGVAFDYNWSDHPVGFKAPDPRAGWNGSTIIKGDQTPEIRRLREYYSLILPNGEKIYLFYWGNDWTSFIDSMHFQIGYNTYQNQVAIWEWINKNIRKDGYSTYRRGVEGQAGAPIPQIDKAKVLGDMMGNVPGVNYDALVPHVQKCLIMSGCTTDIRIDMWGAQIGHESVGLKYMKEIGDAAYFSKYNNRADLGNGPTDGPRYPGRGPIQVTGRSNYRRLSQWAYGEGYCPTPTYFEDNPTELEKYEYAFLGAVWYWTVARPDINALCDKGDVVTVTKRINGGTNGLQDRINRWNHCRTVDYLPLIQAIEESVLSGVDVDRLNKAVDKILGGGTMPPSWPSRGMFSLSTDKPGGVDDTVGMLLNTDGNGWNVIVIIGALLGVPDDVQRVKDTAAGKIPEGLYVDENKWLRERAIAFAKKLEPLCGLLNETFFGIEYEDADSQG